MKKLISILITIVMVLTVFAVPVCAEDLYEGDFDINVAGGEMKVTVDWEDFSGAQCYKVSIDTENEYHSAEGVVTESSYNWTPDYNISPNEVFTITVYAYDETGAVIAQSDTLQFYIIPYLCDYFGVYGDADADEMVTIIDATVVQQYLAKGYYFNAMEECIADVDCDGIVSVMDSTHIQQALAGIRNYPNRTGDSAMIGWVSYDVCFDKFW